VSRFAETSTFCTAIPDLERARVPFAELSDLSTEVAALVRGGTVLTDLLDDNRMRDIVVATPNRRSGNG